MFFYSIQRNKKLKFQVNKLFIKKNNLNFSILLDAS